MNYRKMLEALASYAKSGRAPELREFVQKLVDEEKARRKRTAARLQAMRKALSWYADHMPNQSGSNYKALDIELRRQAVQEVALSLDASAAKSARSKA